MDWDLQKFLSEMHAENRQSIRILNDDIQKGFDTMSQNMATISDDLSEHEKEDALVQARIQSRLEEIEGVLKNGRWFFRIGIVAIITFLFNIILVSLTRGIK